MTRQQIAELEWQTEIANAERSNLTPITLIVNGEPQSLLVEPRVSLLDALREKLQLTGTKKGCDQGACGACTVLADGQRILSCLALAIQYDDCEITTVEGLATDESLSPIQQAFVTHDGFQCGYCTSGQICSAVAMMRDLGGGGRCRGAIPLLGDRRGNLCRRNLGRIELKIRAADPHRLDLEARQ